MSFDLDNYVDVAQRITDFYERHPDGRLTTVDWDVKNDLDGKTFVWVHAKAYRTPDDPLPGDGIAWEPVPGPTQFTRDSELGCRRSRRAVLVAALSVGTAAASNPTGLMNAQTAAWGRAIVALGFETKKIASKQEVQARQNGHAAASPDQDAIRPSQPVQPSQMLVPFGKHKGKKVSEVPTSYWEWWLAQDGNKNPEVLAAVELHLGLTGAASGPSDLDDIPF